MMLSHLHLGTVLYYVLNSRKKTVSVLINRYLKSDVSHTVHGKAHLDDAVIHSDKCIVNSLNHFLVGFITEVGNRAVRSYFSAVVKSAA